MTGLVVARDLSPIGDIRLLPENEAQVRPLTPVEGEPEPSHDLWPTMLRQLDSGPVKAPWYDWALGAGVVVFVAFFPGLVPVLLYYL